MDESGIEAAVINIYREHVHQSPFLCALFKTMNAFCFYRNPLGVGWSVVGVRTKFLSICQRRRGSVEADDHVLYFDVFELSYSIQG